jgi:hypothetical protein
MADLKGPDLRVAAAGQGLCASDRRGTQLAFGASGGHAALAP